MAKHVVTLLASAWKDLDEKDQAFWKKRAEAIKEGRGDDLDELVVELEAEAPKGQDATSAKEREERILPPEQLARALKAAQNTTAASKELALANKELALANKENTENFEPCKACARLASSVKVRGRLPRHTCSIVTAPIPQPAELQPSAEMAQPAAQSAQSTHARHVTRAIAKQSPQAIV